jgi:protein TonB
VVIQFIIDKEGKISNITALTKHGFGMEEEVIRLLKKAPNWKPAIQDGRFVKAYRKQPITFMVIEEGKKKRKNRA